eukprot:scaffold10514_cov72-Cylindrotheca_fusiformis.AAC.2
MKSETCSLFLGGGLEVKPILANRHKMSKFFTFYWKEGTRNLLEWYTHQMICHGHSSWKPRSVDCFQSSRQRPPTRLSQPSSNISGAVTHDHSRRNRESRPHQLQMERDDDELLFRPTDQERIATVSLRYTKHCRHEAERVGLQDEKEAISVIMESQRDQSCCSSSSSSRERERERDDSTLAVDPLN